MTKPPVLILGARSDIGKAVAHKYAALGHPIQLAARSASLLEVEKADIELRHGVPASLHEFDALAIDTHEAFIAGLPALPQIAICAVGLLGHQAESERDNTTAIHIMRSNYEGPASILAVLANAFEVRRVGTIVGISSVAGDRGRATNYMYGSAKAAFTTYLSGLRSRLTACNVHVVTVIPGFVATKMTDGVDLPTRLTAQPEEVADKIERAVRYRKNVVYIRRVWWLIMLIICALPENIFKRLKI